jgi:hypothetical protein
VDRLIRKCRDTSAAVKIVSVIVQNWIRQRILRVANNRSVAS